MYLYQNQNEYEFQTVKTNAKLYAYYHHQYHLDDHILVDIAQYLKESNLVYDVRISIILQSIVVVKLNMYEYMMNYLKELRGMDVHYIDIGYNNMPFYEDMNEKKEVKFQIEHVEDLTYCLMQHLEKEKQFIQIVEDAFVKDVYQAYFLKEGQKVYGLIETILQENNHQDGFYEFPIGYDDPCFDLEVANYFDKMNPYFFK